jgi:putative ABC transport system substrate-binding protein
MAAQGWKEGMTYVLEERWADGHQDRLPGLAKELAAKAPALIVAQPVVAAQAAGNAAPKTPIVVVGGDPVAAGLVKDYRRPGGMITGFSTALTETSEKYLELIIAAAPRAKRVGFLFNSTAPNLALLKENARRSAGQSAVEVRFAEVSHQDEARAALARLASEGIQALVAVGVDALWRKQVLPFTLSQRWPVIGGAGWAGDGALLRRRLS